MVSEFELSKRSRSKLVGVHADLVRVVEHAITITPIDFAVTEGVRGIERQRYLMSRGFSRTLKSKHLTGRAVDVMAVGDLDGDGDVDAQDRAITWDHDLYTQIADAMKHSAAALGVGVRWGGNFKSFFDGPHFELWP